MPKTEWLHCYFVGKKQNSIVGTLTPAIECIKILHARCHQHFPNIAEDAKQSRYYEIQVLFLTSSSAERDTG
jgi:hypothetical protein